MMDDAVFESRITILINFFINWPGYYIWNIFRYLEQLVRARLSGRKLLSIREFISVSILLETIKWERAELYLQCYSKKWGGSVIHEHASIKSSYRHCIDTLLQGRAQDLGFGYLTFSKVQPIFGRRYALRAARVFLRATVARRAAMVRCRRPEAEKKWPHRRGKWNWDS